MYVKCFTSVGLSKDISYKVVRCVKQFLITKMRYPTLIAQFGTRFFKCSEYMKLRQNHVTCRLWKTLEPQICLKCLWNCFQRVQRPQIDLQLTWFGLQSFHFGGVNDFPIFGDFLAYCLYVRAIPPPPSDQGRVKNTKYFELNQSVFFRIITISKIFILQIYQILEFST